VASRVRTALVGCGSLGRLVHLPILVSLPGSRLIAFADADPHALAEGAKIAPDAARFADHRELLTRGDLDAVIVALPTALHVPVGIDVLAAGKHLYLEKPIAPTLREADRLVECWRASDHLGVIGFNYRFHPLYRRLQAMIRDGAIGNVVAMRTVFSAATDPLPEWKKRRDTGGGALLDLGIHHIDLIRFLLGREIRSVSAQLRETHSEDDRVSLDLEIDGGIVVQSLFAFAAVEEDRIEVYGEAGKLTVDRHHSLAVERRPPRVGSTRAARLGLGYRGPRLREMLASPLLPQRLQAPTAEPSFRASLAHFVAAVGGLRAPSPDLDDGFRALEVVAAATRAAADGTRVLVSRQPGSAGGTAGHR
jgi:myo-inositol 2-dehydrogenase / D-chiro-inositol 1-dehydrogenase